MATRLRAGSPLDGGDPADLGWGRRVARGLLARTTLLPIGLCGAVLVALDPTNWPAVVAFTAGIWVFAGWATAYGRSERSRRARLRHAEQRVRWADEGGRPFWANGFLVGLILFPLAALAFFALSFVAGRHAGSLATLKPCHPSGPASCIAREAGVVVGRSVNDASQQSLDVALPTGLRTIQLSSDGWGGRWRGRFPVGERVTVELHGSTAIGVVEPDGHHRDTADNPSDEHWFFLFMGCVFLVGAFPAALLLRWIERLRTDAARLTVLTHGRLLL